MNDISMATSTYFVNKTNAGSDVTDIEGLVTALLSDNRTSNPSQWRSDLEQYIDMDLYLKYLAANTTMRNWDTYGRMTHNCYLYNDPSSNKLVWIPWDNNETFSDGPSGGGGGNMGALDFDFNNLETTPTSSSGDVTWPMISYIYDDATYKAQYDAYIDEFITSSFTVANMSARFNDAHDLIEQYVTGSDGETSGYTSISSASAFNSSVSDLISFISTRWTEADNYTP
jgi:spore coat protein CotH